MDLTAGPMIHNRLAAATVTSMNRQCGIEPLRELAERLRRAPEVFILGPKCGQLKVIITRLPCHVTHRSCSSYRYNGAVQSRCDLAVKPL